MQRSASPDITEGVPAAVVVATPPERRGRGRKGQAQSVGGDNDSPSPIAEAQGGGGGSKDALEGVSTQPAKRGRGRPKKNADLQQQTSTQESPTTVTAVQQPKRRGRKPKLASESQDGIEGDQQGGGDELLMDTTSEAAQNLSYQMSQVMGGMDQLGTPMEAEESQVGLLEGSGFFSSVFKSEQSFGQQSGGGIPGLDLNDGDGNAVNMPFATDTPPSLPPSKNFAFSTVSAVAVEDELKSMQELQINKFNVDSDSVRKEETATEENENSKVRRSSRIKTLEEQRGSRGRRREVVTSLSEGSGLSRSNVSLNEDDSNSNSSISMQASGTTSGYSSPSRESSLSGGMTHSLSTPSLQSISFGMTSATFSNGAKPLKVKSRWRYSLDAEAVKSFSSAGETASSNNMDSCPVSSAFDGFVPSDNLVRRRGHLAFDGTDIELLEKLKRFDGIDESIYRTERKISKEGRGMVCDCYLSNEDIMRGESGCSEDCLNRLLMVECGNRCPTEGHCSNKRFQKKEYASLEVFKTEKKGHGLRTLQFIPEGGFVIEYVGEVLDVPQFEHRTAEYAKGNQEHFYFMALKSDAIIDATLRGNCSRFINHSCEPNCETQKWTVNGEVRIGFFAITDLQPGDEITFDYQFQRYGKKAQKCFCMTESCRGWIGEEEDESEAFDDKEGITTEAETEVEDFKAKTKPKLDKKRRKNVQLEDMAFREELAKLEASGLKNRNHTLTLSRLMVRAESWDDRERLLSILTNGDTPCRRLFLDYHGLRLIWSWMVDLPLPHENDGPQLIRNDIYHLLFLRALQSLPIPNKSMLLESKVWALIEKWSSSPSLTASVTLVKRNDTPVENKNVENENASSIDDSTKVEEEKMDTVEIKEEPSSTVDGMQEVVEDKLWNFVSISKSLLESWAELKEVFRIPKKERVEQMKEHEREADKGQQTSLNNSSLSGVSSNSYDRDHRNKQYRNRGERRVPVLDPTQHSFSYRHPNRMMAPPGVTKEQWRKNFEQTVRQREEQEHLRRQQDALVNLHQERCGLVGLDPATTPIVDPHGVHYLDPKTVMWKPINIDDPTMPPELIKFVQLSQYPPSSEAAPTATVETPVATAPVEPEQAFPPWPPGLPPPPPLPPRELPKNWKMAVDDEGRCYYYHIRTRITRWDPPSLDDVSSSDLSESSSEEEEEVEETVAEGSPVITKSSIQTWRTKLIERAARRKKSGLVQERIISPRADDEKGFSKEMVKENKKKALEEKLARLAMKDETSEGESLRSSEGEETSGGDVTAKSSTELVEKSNPVSKKPSVSIKKRRKEKLSSSKSLAKSKPKPSSSKSEEHPASTSPIETELDLTLSQQNLDEDDDVFLSRVTAGPSRIIGSTPSMDVIIPGLGLDSRDIKALKEMDAKKKADRAARHAAKKKAQNQKKAKEKVVVEAGEKRLSSKEASSIKDAFRNSIATVVVAHLNPYRKSEHIKNTDDFKHLARKITHAILLKELKHTRDVTSLEVTDSVKHKTKEYIKKFMARFPNGIYIRSPENSQAK